jgi:hypothetical protein
MINAIGAKREAIVSATAYATARYKKCSSATSRGADAGREQATRSDSAAPHILVLSVFERVLLFLTFCDFFY